jgi:hypothetical protein
MVYQICIDIKSMEEQLDRMSSKDSPSSNAGIYLVLEKQREPIAGIVIEDVFIVLPSEFQAKSTSDQVKEERENERSVTLDGFVLVRSSNHTDPKESCNIAIHANAGFSGDLTNEHVQSAINEGQSKFAEDPQMKLDKDPFLTNMKTVELEGKKILVGPSQTELTKGKEAIIGEERHPMMIRPKNE